MTAVDHSVTYDIVPVQPGTQLKFSLIESTVTLAQYDEAVQAFADVLIAAHPLANIGVIRTIHSDDQTAPWYPEP